jgi:hypothetical protein
MLTEVRPEDGGLSLDRRASLAGETLRLIRSIADSLSQDAEQARLHCAFAGDPTPIAQELDTLVELVGAMRRAGDRDGEPYVLGQALFCVLAGILVMIASTSSLTLIPLLYWSIAGLAQAYARAPGLARARETKQDGDPRLIVAS